MLCGFEDPVYSDFLSHSSTLDFPQTLRERTDLSLYCVILFLNVCSVLLVILAVLSVSIQLKSILFQATVTLLKSLHYQNSVLGTREFYVHSNKVVLPEVISVIILHLYENMALKPDYH